MSRSLLWVSMLGLCAACASSGTSPNDYSVLDFSRPPNDLYGARLVVLDGSNVIAPITKTSFRVAPGVHEIVVAAAITDPMQVGRNPAGRTGSDPGKATIEVQAGKRYRIATRLLDQRGAWEPLVWKIEDL
ncbi:MAG: hypothetical protein AMJ59_00995 [Gammaproteobacteria bacterium SG8_31]|jgi:hypothetical protein|nr:MAG: hypothetical protein AMJ59_00995 [Gammaproteobacteria bacterium SG8_31]